MNTGEFWASAVAAAVVAVVLGELIDVGAWLAPRIIQRASARMPTPELQARYREEWLAELDQLDGLKLVKLAKAVTLWVSSWRTGNAWRTDRVSIGLARSIRGFMSGISYSARLAWQGKDLPSPRFGWNGQVPPEMEEQLNASPFLVIFPLALMLITVPTNVPVSVAIEVSGGQKFAVNVKPEAGGQSRCAKWLVRIGRMLAVGFYDAYLIRTGTRLREIRSLHMTAYRAIKFRENGN